MTSKTPPPLLDIREFSLAGRLDARQVQALQQTPGWRAQAIEFRIDLSGILTIDPIGATLLAALCRDIEDGGHGRVAVTGLSRYLRQCLRRHPLLQYHRDADHLFSDPYEVPGSSSR